VAEGERVTVVPCVAVVESGALDRMREMGHVARVEGAIEGTELATIAARNGWTAEALTIGMLVVLGLEAVEGDGGA
jgi:hypothetical protein